MKKRHFYFYFPKNTHHLSLLLFSMSNKSLTANVLNTTVLVAALGYFVDIYDLQLFNVIGKSSLGPEGLNLDTEQINHYYDYVLFNWQMAGMLLGGILWGILGDQKGRKSILFGSILLYSIANIANAFVTNVEQYQFVRLLAGLGLAGELGAAITLVSETIEKENRGYGTMLIVTLGALGAVAAALVANMKITLFGLAAWQVAYLIGGFLGLVLLLMRFGTFESGMFEDVQKDESVKKGNFITLFTDKKRFIKYLSCILIGLPVWFVIGILIKFSDKFVTIIGSGDWTFNKGYAIMYAYIGLSVGDFAVGVLSQVFKNRKKVVISTLLLSASLMVVFFLMRGVGEFTFYFMCFLLGASTGYWALFVTIASEQFGTNIRATATTTVPNFVRGGVIPITLGYKALGGSEISTAIFAACVVGAICSILALLATMNVSETFGKDLNYLEEHGS